MTSLKPLVALKSKKGELDALDHLRSEGDAPATLMIELLDSVNVGSTSILLPALIRAAVHVNELGRSLWIDTHRLTATSPLSMQPGGALEFLDNKIETALHEKFGLFVPDVATLVPVVPDTASVDELGAVALLQEHRQRDVAVRIGQLHIRTSELIERVRRVAHRARVEAGRLQAVIDVGFVETVQSSQVERISQMALVLGELLGPGSTTLLAGSVPATRDGFVTTTRDRPEVSLWRAAHEETATVELQYGDYGVVHPIPPRPGDPGPRFTNPYLYYTVPGRMVTLRRKLIRENRRPVAGAAVDAFADLADELVYRPEFAGGDYSWGDQELAHCRRGGGTVAGTVPRWISMATSHHLAHVTRRPAAEL